MTIFEAVEAGDLVLPGIADRRGRRRRRTVRLRPVGGLHLAAGRGDLEAASTRCSTPDPDARRQVARAVFARLFDAPLEPGGTVADLSTPQGASTLGRLFGQIWEASKPKASGVSGHTPLADAAVGGHAEVLRLLLDRGADVNARDGEDYTAAGFAVAAGRRVAMELLIARGAGLEAKTRDGLTPLMLAALDGRLGIVRTLLDAGADPNAESRALMFTLTPLSLAVQDGHREVIDALVAAGAMGSKAPLAMGIALGEAVEEDRPDLVRSLLAAGVDVNSQAGGGDHLHAAAERGHVEMIRLLVAAGADVAGRRSFRGRAR